MIKDSWSGTSADILLPRLETGNGDHTARRGTGSPHIHGNWIGGIAPSERHNNTQRVIWYLILFIVNINCDGSGSVGRSIHPPPPSIMTEIFLGGQCKHYLVHLRWLECIYIYSPATQKPPEEIMMMRLPSSSSSSRLLLRTGPESDWKKRRGGGARKQGNLL